MDAVIEILRFNELSLHEKLAVVLKVAVGLVTLYVAKRYFFPFYIPSVPIRAPNHWFFGFANSIPSKKGKLDSHLLTLSEVEKTGKVFQYYNFGRLRVLVSDKYIAKYLMEKVNGKGFYHRGNPYISHQNIFNLDTGPEWKKRRTAFRQSFSMTQLKSCQEQLKILTVKLLDALKTCADKGSVVEIDKIFGQVTVDVICSVGFQYDMHAMEGSQISQELNNSIRQMMSFGWFLLLPFAEYLFYLPIPVITRYREARMRITKFCMTLFQHIKKLHSEGTLKKESVGYALLEFSKLEGVTDEDICAEILVMFIAGHETTSHTLSFFVYSLATHPEVQSKCHSAMDEQQHQHTVVEGVNGSGGAPSLMSLLPAYVEATLKESMRKYPVVARGAMRQVQDRQGVTVPLSVLNRSYTEGSSQKMYQHDVIIPYQAWVQVYTYNIHNSRLNWGERVDEFLPERFLPSGHFTGANSSSSGSSSDGATGGGGSINPLSSPAIYGGGGAEADDLMFVPFAYGLRNCIGMNFALMEMRSLITEMLARFSFELADESLRDETIAYESQGTSKPHKLLPVYVRARKL